MKVLMLTDNLIRGGKERRLLELLKGLAEYAEVDCQLVVFSRKIEFEEFLDLGIKIHFLERNPKQDPRVFYRLYKVCQAFQPQVIHSWGSMPSIYALPSVWLLGIRLINAMITNAPPVMNWRQTSKRRALLTFPFSDVILGNSQAGLRAYNAPLAKSRCIYNGFDFRRINQLQSRKAILDKFQIRTPLLVGMVGAFHPRKDYATFIQAALEVVQKRTDVSFIMIGGGPNLADCQKLVGAEYQDRIIFAGLQTQVESIVNCFDVGVLLSNSRVHGEGISNAILEYMALGKAVVASIGGGTAEIVDEQTGILIEPHRPEQMVEALDQLLDAADLREEMGRAGKKKVEQHFNLAKMAAIYHALYWELDTNEPPAKSIPTGLNRQFESESGSL